MNSKALFICLTILAILTFSAQSLTINKHSEHHMVKHLAQRLSHKVLSYHLAEAPAPALPENVVADLVNFLNSDPEILDILQNGKTITPGVSKKIQDYLANNKGFVDAMTQTFDLDSSFPQCYKDLSADKKSKLAKVMIGQFDFGKMLTGQEQSQQDAQAAKKAVEADSDLGASVAQCLDGHFQPPKV